MKKKWTDEEIRFLKFAYPNKDITTKEISIALSRSFRSIHAKATRLGLKKYKEVLNDDLKRCTKCKTIYKKDFFNKKDNGRRLHSWCKNCLRERRNEKYDSNNSVESVGVESVGVESVGVKTKKCPKCKEVKPVSEFNKNRNKKDGLNGYCILCQNKANEGYKLKKIKERGW